MKAGIRPENSALQQCDGYGITMDEMSARKKISRVSLYFSYLKILKQPFWAI
jgi:hypothetical protein